VYIEGGGDGADFLSGGVAFEHGLDELGAFLVTLASMSATAAPV
jgi:hypothetical protein